MAQFVRYVIGLIAFVVILIVSVVMVTIDGEINRWIILISSGLVSSAVFVIITGGYMLADLGRLSRFSLWVTPKVNKVVRSVTFDRVQSVLVVDDVTKFFSDIHYDYKSLMRDRKSLRVPFLWGLVHVITDVGLFLITFWAIGYAVNPAPVFIAYGVATVAGIVAVTPGGAGVYETIMVMFLSMAGMSSAIAITSIVLTRALLLAGTIIFGYVFYQHAILRYGKGVPPVNSK